MLDDVRRRLESLGYTPTEEDDWLIQFCIRNSALAVKNNCNLEDVPEKLIPTVIDMAAGEFLFEKKGAGQLTELDQEQLVRSISEGAISVSFGEGIQTREQRLDTLIGHLRTTKGKNLAAFRRLSW